MFGGTGDQSGQLADGDSDLVEYWVLWDLGIVQEQAYGTFRLEGYFGPPVADKSLSWGAVARGRRLAAAFLGSIDHDNQIQS